LGDPNQVGCASVLGLETLAVPTPSCFFAVDGVTRREIVRVKSEKSLEISLVANVAQPRRVRDLWHMVRWE
jgi:hypothetical protein